MTNPSTEQVSASNFPTVNILSYTQRYIWTKQEKGTNQLGFGGTSRERRGLGEAQREALAAPLGVGEMGELGLGERVACGED